jgi:PAS domain S-box-containing protein
MLHKRQSESAAPHRYWLEPVSSSHPSSDDSTRPSMEDFRLIADNLPVLCWIARGDGYIFWYNRRWHDYCGSTPEAMEGWGWQSVHDPNELPAVMERWQLSIANAKPFEMIFPLRGSDGVFRRFLTRIVPVIGPGGAVVRWIGTNTEVESQLSTEAALEASEGKLRVLTDAMPQMIWSTLPDGHHDYYNARWYEFTGVPYGSTDGEGWNDMFHPEDRERAWARWRHSLETGEPYEIESLDARPRAAGSQRCRCHYAMDRDLHRHRRCKAQRCPHRTDQPRTQPPDQEYLCGHFRPDRYLGAQDGGSGALCQGDFGPDRGARPCA